MTAPTTTAPVLSRLRPAVHVAPVADGLLFVGWQQSLVLHGSESLSRLWDAIFPHLHRGVDVDELLGALPESARTAARSMLGELDDHGFLLRERAGEPEPQPHAENARHPEHRRTRAFLDAAALDPAGAEHSLRTTRVAVHGTGDVAFSAARSLIRLGAGDVVVADTGLRDRLADLADEHGAVLRADDPSHDAVTITVGAIEAPGHGPRVGVLQLGDHAVVGPLRTRATDPGAELALHRMRACGDDAEPAPVPTVAARLAGGLAALQVVHHVCDISTEYDGMAHLVDAERLATTTHPVAPVGDVDARPLSGSAAPAPDLGALDVLGDERTGLIAPLTPADLPQTPLALVGTAERGGETVHGWARSGDVARYRAALEAARRAAGPAPALWALDHDGPPVRARLAVAAAGGTLDDLLRDALLRLVAATLVEDREPGRWKTTGGRFTGADATGPVPDAWSRWSVRGGPVALERRIHRAACVGDRALVVELVEAATGRTLGLAMDPDVDVATAVALDHATAGTDTGPGLGPVPLLSVPPWATADAETIPDVPGPRGWIESLCRPGEVVVGGRWTAEPGWDALGAIGWVGFAATAGGGPA